MHKLVHLASYLSHGFVPVIDLEWRTHLPNTERNNDARHKKYCLANGTFLCRDIWLFLLYAFLLKCQNYLTNAKIKLPSGRHGMFNRYAKTSDTWIPRFLLLLISFHNVLHFFSVLALVVVTAMPKN